MGIELTPEYCRIQRLSTHKVANVTAAEAKSPTRAECSGGSVPTASAIAADHPVPINQGDSTQTPDRYSGEPLAQT